MISPEALALLMFAATCVALLAGYPVAFTLAGSALVFAYVGWMLGAFDLVFLLAFPQRIFGVMTNEVLIAVPMFVFMGCMLERSNVAEELLGAAERLFGGLRGGLGVAVSFVGALLAASTGIVGATVVTMGLLSLPTMLKRGYAPSLATGSICAAGTLGQIIPPSIVLILLGEVISNAYQKAQLEQGIFSPDVVSVGDLFAGSLFPGLMLVGMYIAYQLVYGYLRPKSSPALSFEERHQNNESILLHVSRALVPPLLLIIAVLGSVLAGVATPTESASAGAFGAILLAGRRLPEARRACTIALLSLAPLFFLATSFDMRIARDVIPLTDWIAIISASLLCVPICWGVGVGLFHLYRTKTLVPVCQSAGKIASMVFIILIGASMFSLVFRGFGGDDMIHEFLSNLPGGIVGGLILVMAVMFVLGFFLDFIEITFVVVPLVAPTFLAMGVDPVWLGVMMAINLQTSFLTPPFGFALFYLRGVAPASVKTMEIYRGVIPFVMLQLLALLLLAYFPALATWLPEVIFG